MTAAKPAPNLPPALPLHSLAAHSRLGPDGAVIGLGNEEGAVALGLGDGPQPHLRVSSGVSAARICC